MKNFPHTPATAWSRRRILGWGATGAAGSLVAYMAWPNHEAISATAANPQATPFPIAPLPDLSPTAAMAPAREMSRENFLPYLHSSFRLDTGVECTLVEVSAVQNHVTSVGQFSCFTLLFKAPLGSAIASEVHSLRHAQMGAMNLFLSPVGGTPEHLEVVFSQRV